MTYYVHIQDSSGMFDYSSLQNIIFSLRMLACGVITNFMDEYLKIGETTVLKSSKRFVKIIVLIFMKST